MSNDRVAEVARIAAAAGFDVSVPYCAMETMVAGIRALESLAPGTPLTGTQRAALLENLRRVLTRTATAARPHASLTAQSQLSRWAHLRDAAPEAADAYADVLRWLGIEVPECLLS